MDTFRSQSRREFKLALDSGSSELLALCAEKLAEAALVAKAQDLAAQNQSLARALQRTVAGMPPVNPTDRLDFALEVTNNHYHARTTEDLEASIVESLNDPFEVQNILCALNTVEGPGATARSGGTLRWLSVLPSDLVPLKSVSDFARLVFMHLTPRA